MRIDPESFALAQHFLDTNGADKQVQSLAETIQQAVEDWFTLEQIAQGDKPPPSEVDGIDRAAASIASMVDEYTGRCWNDEGRANFALIVERRLRRFIPQHAVTAQDDDAKGSDQ